MFCASAAIIFGIIFVLSIVYAFFFFFQAEDGIRDLIVTGVQTCALPISRCSSTRVRSASSRIRRATPRRFGSARCRPRSRCSPPRDSAASSRRSMRADRKSTRLNSSHDQISYAVFCLKKKKKKEDTPIDYTQTTTQNGTPSRLDVHSYGHDHT